MIKWPFDKFFQGLIATTLGVATCFVFAHFLIDSIVLSTSLAGLLGSFIFIKHSRLQQQFYCGCFIAMSSSLLLYRLELTACSVIIAAVLFQVSIPFFRGHGGKLGAIAFLACLGGFAWIL